MQSGNAIPSEPVSIFDDVPLVDGSQTIRILTLLPGELGDPVECMLEVVSPQDDPAYEALSYAWGDPKVTLPIKVQGNGHEVTTNLHSALVHLRRESTPRKLWIDALCINQHDIVELGHQVSFMKAIYKKSFPSSRLAR